MTKHSHSSLTETNIPHIPVSILILTLDEEVNIGTCLAAVRWSDDVVVFDSLSTDKTLEIAKSQGARVIQREFDNYAAQRNAALNEVEYKHAWILMIDADEQPDAKLTEEIRHLVTQEASETTLYRMRRKDHFFGRWIKRSSGYPTWFGRLFRVGTVTVEREINEEYHTSGKIGHLQGHLLHYPFNKGIAYWFRRHNRYSSMEATALIQEVKGKLNIHRPLCI